MFYVDFTSPDDHTYRIDLATHPVTYQCPVCGEETVISFEDDNWCRSCYEEQQAKEREMIQKRSRLHLIEEINKHCHSHITEETLQRWEEEMKSMLLEEKCDFALKQIRQLRQLCQLRKEGPLMTPSVTHPKVVIIPPCEKK